MRKVVGLDISLQKTHRLSFTPPHDRNLDGGIDQPDTPPVNAL